MWRQQRGSSILTTCTDLDRDTCVPPQPDSASLRKTAMLTAGTISGAFARVCVWTEGSRSPRASGHRLHHHISSGSFSPSPESEMVARGPLACSTGRGSRLVAPSRSTKEYSILIFDPAQLRYLSKDRVRDMAQTSSDDFKDIAPGRLQEIRRIGEAYSVQQSKVSAFGGRQRCDLIFAQRINALINALM